MTFSHGWHGPPTPHLLLLSPSWALEHSWSQLAPPSSHPSLHLLPCKIFQIPFQATWMSSETWRQPRPSADIFHATVLLAFRIQPSNLCYGSSQPTGPRSSVSGWGAGPMRYPFCLFIPCLHTRALSVCPQRIRLLFSLPLDSVPYKCPLLGPRTSLLLTSRMSESDGRVVQELTFLFLIH